MFVYNKHNIQKTHKIQKKTPRNTRVIRTLSLTSHPPQLQKLTKTTKHQKSTGRLWVSTLLICRCTMYLSHISFGNNENLIIYSDTIFPIFQEYKLKLYILLLAFYWFLSSKNYSLYNFYVVFAVNKHYFKNLQIYMHVFWIPQFCVQ